MEPYIQKILDVHGEFLRRLAHHELPIEKSVPLILTRILECDEELLEFSLGNIGQKLRLFANKIDFSHPEIFSIFDGVLADDQEFSKECLEILLLAKFAKDHQLTKILPLFGKITKESLSKTVIRKIDSPQLNKMHVRLLKDPLEREEIRLTKRMQTIDLQNLYNKGEEIWNSQPDSFSKFIRFDSAYHDDLMAAERKVVRYEELGCISLANEIRKSIDIFRENMEQSHYGFNRITMTNAAVILAKSMGFTYAPAQEVCGGFVGSYKKEAKITINRNFFGKYNFDPKQIISEFAQSPIFTTQQSDPYIYQPRVYPLHDFWEFASQELKDVIALLESFPDAGGKPIFDHFGVIVPSVALPITAENVYTFLDEKGLVQVFKFQEEAVKTLDSTLMKGGYINSIIVGEKDNKCYFLSYFTSAEKKK